MEKRIIELSCDSFSWNWNAGDFRLKTIIFILYSATLTLRQEPETRILSVDLFQFVREGKIILGNV